jgi:hypothetical protein
MGAMLTRHDGAGMTLRLPMQPAYANLCGSAPGTAWVPAQPVA